MTFDREKGIKAIICLQAKVGITETYEQAEVGWNNMDSVQQELTMAFYKAIE